jgi:hypothetical protein
MPITGPTSFVSTTELFLTHWGLANTALGVGNEIVLQGNVALAGLQTQYDALIAKRLDLTGKLNIEETARGDVELKKIAGLLRLNQFNEAVRADFGGTKWEHALPNVPGIGDGQGVFVPALEDGSTLWGQLNAGIAPAPPLLLLGAFAQATFATEIVALNTAYKNWRAAGLIAGLALAERNDIQEVIQPLLVLYRKKLPTKFAVGHALVESLPALSPPPGSTPDGVTINGAWNTVSGQADIHFGPSTSANVVQLELRVCSGATYNTDLESVVASLTPADPRVFHTVASLPAPGNIASFKVYEINSTGNEKGSNTAVVTRP